MSRIIDSHSHCIYSEYLDIVAKNGALMEDGFPLPTDWSVEKQLELMEKGGIEWTTEAHP